MKPRKAKQLIPLYLTAHDLWLRLEDRRALRAQDAGCELRRRDRRE
jgi:hypothetical protein